MVVNNMQKTTYKILESDNPANENDLNIVGKDGWKLCTILPFNNKLYYYFICIP